MPAFKPITLSKTRFKLALECPRKLDYARDSRYYNIDDHNSMMRSLAEGGHKVGELARRMFPGGELVCERHGTAQAEKTEALLTQRNVTIYEATIRHGNLLVRVDVLEKEGNKVRLIEVKAKGYDPDKDEFRTTRNGINPIKSGWRSYFYDVAYQDYVFRKAFPEFDTTAYLLVLDKRQRVGFDGLNGMFQVQPDGTVPPVSVSAQFDISKLAPPILNLIDVSQDVKALQEFPIEIAGLPARFHDAIDAASAPLEQGNSFPVTVGAQCKDCQFYVDPAETASKGLSGWHTCLMAQGAITAESRREDTVFDLYKIRENQLSGYLKKNQSIALDKIPPAGVEPKGNSEEKISEAFRRHLQFQEAHGKVIRPYILKRPLKAALDALEGPLHFLDFETSRPALPWHRGRRPYDQILFQFSHHILLPSGKLEHRTQCLETTPGTAPSLEVLRALKKALSGDRGRIIHWSPFEGSVLRSLQDQIEFEEPADTRELQEFIHELRGPTGNDGRLFDLCKVVTDTIFYPGTSGSSSIIKQVLPAVLQTSPDIRKRYGRPVYGTEAMTSHNFRNWTWIKMADGVPQDPYKLLDPALHGNPGGASYIADGGAALMAYDRLQQTDLPATDRTAIESQLLRYCELDTLAMVMVYQSLTEA